MNHCDSHMVTRWIPEFKKVREPRTGESTAQHSVLNKTRVQEQKSERTRGHGDSPWYGGRTAKHKHSTDIDRYVKVAVMPHNKKVL